MKLPFFSSFIIFIFVLTHQIRKTRRDSERQDKAFWDKESRANSTRKKSLDNLDYIKIPLDELPTEIMPEDETVSDCIRTVTELAGEKIVNFTGISNTDLKLEYGAANIELLSAFDQRFTNLVCTMQKWADVLWESGYEKEAAVIMEFCINIRTDISSTYYKLAQYYEKQGQPEKISHLIEVAETLKSLNKKSIEKHLKESYQ